MTRLWSLDLSSNQLDEIPTGVFSTMTSLRYLYLSSNQLDEIPLGVFSTMTSLLTLNLSSNQLDEIPTGVFSTMTSLRYLYLSSNQLDEIPTGVFSTMTSLWHLDLSSNQLDEIPTGVFSTMTSLRYLYLSSNQLDEIPTGVFSTMTSLLTLNLSSNQLDEIPTGVFSTMTSLLTLNLSSNQLDEIPTGVFSTMTSLWHLDLSSNQLDEIPTGVFSTMTSLLTLNLSNNHLNELMPSVFSILFSYVTGHSPYTMYILSLSHNNLSMLYSGTFYKQTALEYLEIQHNQLKFLAQDVFHNLTWLINLDLSVNKLTQIPTELLLYCINLERLDLRDNPLLRIEPNTFVSLNETANVIVSDPSTCCFTSANCMCDKAPSPFLTCKRLLPYYGLRIAIWFACALAIFGNILVFYFRYKQKQQGNKVQFLLITNLSISDFSMGIYLVILISVDMYYTHYFPSFSESWRASILCRITGAFSVLSSEASTFFITLITIDRFLGVKYTFSGRRLSTKVARVLVALLWFVALGISIAISALPQGNLDFYAVSEICVGLPITRLHNHILNETEVPLALNRPYPWRSKVYTSTQVNAVPTGSRAAMYFSIAITGLNMACFLVVGYCYLAIFFSARQTSRNAGRSTNLKEEIRRAMKIFALVFTDFCCRMPIGVYSILVQAGAVEDDPVAYAWIATLALPINSAINPFLYTLPTVISSRRERNYQQENIPLKIIRRT
ncbi:uncharacterized protein [Amphiura filiformis]|uniref:uncharacterized protein n=1 Tax=Amphiura filiformis TaxID=82378 RepID=UPI003B216C59